MKTTLIFRTALYSTLVCTLLLGSCKKREETPIEEPLTEDTEQGTANDNNVAEFMLADIENIGGQVVETNTLTTYRTSGESGTTGELAIAPCATITSAAKVHTVDFGTVGCVGQDGNVRTGKLIFDLSASATNASYYRNPGFVMTVTSQNYKVNNYQVNIINKTVKNTTPSSISPGYNPGINLTWSVSANISITKPNNAGTITWQSSRQKELLNTSDTNCYKGQAHYIRWNLAKVQLNGNTSGVNAKQENFLSSASNLVRDFNCAPDPNRPHRHPFISGVLSYTPGTRPARSIDYGNGSCDLNAVLSIKGQTFTIVLP